MAQIYLAKTKGLAGFEKYLALKIINSEYANEQRFIQMLIDEAKITVSLSHVNIAQVFDLGHVDGIYYIAMEYVDGLDILRLVNGLHRLDEKVPIEAAIFIARQVCAGLDYAHSRTDPNGSPLNLVHRDISPQNILVSCNGEVKIVDFGIAKAAGLSTKTQAGVVKGKVNYMAPEQVMGKPADRRCDVFSLGIVVWEMLTSQMVYSGDNVGDLVAKVRRAKIAPPSSVRKDIPPELDGIVLRALAANPQERYQTAHDFQAALTNFLSLRDPNYSASDVARLIDVVRSEGRVAKLPRQDRFSKGDQLADEHSVIFSLTKSGRAHLVVNAEGKRQVIQLGKDLTIGRAGQLAITDVRVSRHHARVYQQGDAYLVEDLGSSNGTYVNSERIELPRLLHHGDEIRVGKTHLTFLHPERSQNVGETPEPQPSRATRLVISHGDHTLIKLLEDDVTELNYIVQVGSFNIQGSVASVVRKNDTLWLQPTEGRVPVQINGQSAKAPTKISIGDRVEIGSTICVVKE